MARFICLGFAAVRRRNIAHHRAWIMRGYALGIGAGTQVLTHLPWFLFPSIQGELARTLFMGAGWVINLAVVEWIFCANAVISTHHRNPRDVVFYRSKPARVIALYSPKFSNDERERTAVVCAMIPIITCQ